MTSTTLVAADLVLTGRGILAADQSVPATDARLRLAGVIPDAESRRAYREMLVTTPALSAGISGVILSDETFRARTGDGRSFPEALAGRGLLPGIKVDTRPGRWPARPARRTLAGDVLLRHGPGRPGASRLARRPGLPAAGQRALANRVACNVAALQGSYTPALEPSYVLAQGSRPTTSVPPRRTS